MQANNKTALITGASSGIGLELARLFAADHYNLVLVSRDELRLREVASELRSLGSPTVTVIPKDLSKPNAPREVYDETQMKGIIVDVLVNDAGVGEHGYFVESDLEKDLHIINLNISGLVAMTKFYLRDMVGRNEGKVLQLASIASYQPTPLLAVYAATKSFVLSFTDALINELKDTLVTMTALIPPPTDTDFFRKAGAENTHAAQDKPEDPKVVAKAGYKALMEGKHHAFAPGTKKQAVMSSLMPNEANAAMARKLMEEAPAEKSTTKNK